LEEGPPNPGSTHGLRKEAGLLQIVAYGIGNIIGAGIYVLVGDASGLAGNAVWLAFLVGAIVALFTGLTYAELASMYPRAASEYVYLGKAYGNRTLAFMTEWMMLVTEIIAAAAVSIGFAGYLSSSIDLPILPVAAALLVVLSLVSLLGVKASLELNTVLSMVAIGGLILVGLAGFGKLGTVPYTSPRTAHLVFSALLRSSSSPTSASITLRISPRRPSGLRRPYPAACSLPSEFPRCSTS
jgi:APA family basic amino acid/polyamine antiporter